MSVHHLQITSSERFHHHFKICLLWFLQEKGCSVSTYLFCCAEMSGMFISSNAIWVTSSDTGSIASRARTELTRSKCKWTRIWTMYLECRWNDPVWRFWHFYFWTGCLKYYLLKAFFKEVLSPWPTYFFREFLQEMILVCLHLIKLFLLERRLFLKYPVRKKHEGKNFF